MSDQEIGTWLRTEIEAMSAVPPRQSAKALSENGTAHIVFGFLDDSPGHETRAKQLAEGLLENVRKYRDKLDGPMALVWRNEPQIERLNQRLTVRVRLCFEPV